MKILPSRNSENCGNYPQQCTLPRRIVATEEAETSGHKAYRAALSAVPFSREAEPSAITGVENRIGMALSPHFLPGTALAFVGSAKVTTGNGKRFVAMMRGGKLLEFRL
jgi:hypothetical protein